MKARTTVLTCLIGVVVLSMCYEYSRAESKADGSSLKVGVVSVRKILGNSEKQAKYMKEAIAEQNRIEAELEKLAKDIEANQAGLRTLKIGSSDYLKQMRGVLEKQANLHAQQQFHERQIELQDKQWHEELYKEILQETRKVAEQRGLDLVLEKSEPELPALSAKDLALAIRMHKLLYSGGCLDITDEVMARLDSGK